MIEWIDVKKELPPPNYIHMLTDGRSIVLGAINPFRGCWSISIPQGIHPKYTSFSIPFEYITHWAKSIVDKNFPHAPVDKFDNKSFPLNTWVPLASKRPSKSDEYLVIAIFPDTDYPDPVRLVAHYQHISKREGDFMAGTEILNVTHWMDLTKIPGES